MTSTVDVVIVGAGPTGLTLAAQLQQFGTSVRIVDRQLDRVHESRALVLQPRSLEVLRRLGGAETLVERGNDAVQLELHSRGRVVRMRLFDIGLEDTAYPFLLFISQAETEAILSEYLSTHGLPVERGVELVGFSADVDGVACTLRAGNGATEVVRCRYLVGCDGAHSIVREGAGIPFEGGSYPHTFLLADLEVDGALERGAGHAFLGDHGILLFFPLGTPATWRIIGMRPKGADAQAEQSTEPLSLEELQRICDRFTGGSLRLRDPVWLTYFRLHHRHAARYRTGRVFLAGDAAHVHSPAGGQGMNTGIQDAWNLGWKLALVARGDADPALLDSYESERRPVGRFVLRFTDRATTIATSDAAVIRLARTRIAPRLLPRLVRFRKGRAYVFRTLSQLAINYRNSPAVEEGTGAPRTGPRAGDRLPDARVVLDGRESWLHESLAASAFTVLLCGPTNRWLDDEISAIHERHAGLVDVHRLTADVDPSGKALARLAADQPMQYVVRPDGHIGYRSAGTDMRGAQRYLARWLG